MTNFRAFEEYSRGKPKVREVNPQVVERLNKMVAEKRTKRPFKEPIMDIPKYNWLKDPNHYCDENGNKPYNRCMHCGYQYNMATGFTAFCNICTKSLKYTEGGVLTKAESLRTRVPEGKKATSLLEGNKL